MTNHITLNPDGTRTIHKPSPIDPVTLTLCGKRSDGSSAFALLDTKNPLCPVCYLD